MSHATTYEEGCSLVPIDLSNPTESSELLRQRKVCGWHYTPKHLDQWRYKAGKKEKTFFWITIKTTHDNTSVRAGHISVDALEDEVAAEFQSFDKSIMTINQLFILPEYRCLGLGRKAMDKAEKIAVEEPYGSTNCRAIVLDTVSKQFFESKEGREQLCRLFPEAPWSGWRNSQTWYERRGYTKVEVAPRYTETTPDGEEVSFGLVYLKKDL